MQQYFFVSCSLQDMFRLFNLVGREPLDHFPFRFAIQLNDTHPSIAVAEMMRLLVDEYRMDWDPAWQITQKACAYNHTLYGSPGKMAGGPVWAAAPRHLEIIYEINRRFLDEVQALSRDEERVARLSLTNGERYVQWPIWRVWEAMPSTELPPCIPNC
jgi:starch phosphorylase